MARIRSVDFLPEIFKTDTNKEFLGSTLDQLIQQPKLKQTQGFVGRTFGPGVSSSDAYVLEPNSLRTNYQLEPGVVFKDENNDVETAITYLEILDALSAKGANVTQHDRLFSEKIYSWSPLIDFDKFVNHSQYYWLPGGPDSVDVSVGGILLEDDFDITRNTTSTTYSFDNVEGLNPTITLARGGTYTFNVNQAGNNFFIQTESGKDGLLNSSPNINTRNVLGVTNNGEDSGTVTFAVPQSNAQQFFYDLTDIGTVDLATFNRFDSINAKLVSQLGNIDGILDLEGKTIVFLDPTPGASADLGWQFLELHEESPFELDPFEETTFIDLQADRYSIYQIEFIGDASDPIIKLNLVQAVSNLEKFTIAYGGVFSNKSFFKESTGFFAEVPLLSAAPNVLYYQDGIDENRFGIINLVDSANDAILEINDIIGKKTYTSPNGVKFTNGLKIIFRGNTNPSSFQDQEFYVECVGLGIQLVPVTDLVTPEDYIDSELEPFDFSPFDTTNFDQDANSPKTLDFITVNRASRDLNPWSRSNRWVHIDVIEQTAELNGTIAVQDNDFRANRPIIEFEKNLRLFNFGTESKQPVNVIDFSETDALSNVNNTFGFFIDGFPLASGSRIIFAADTNPAVRNKIYEVQFIDPTGDDALTINLVEASDAVSEVDNNVLCLNGLTLQGKVFRFDGTDWVETQQKTSVNQPPLFDVFDNNGLSFSTTSAYPNTSFTGTKLFSYAVGTGTNDTILGFPLQFLNIDNLGDIVYDNNLYKDTFTHSAPTQTKNISDGFIRKHTSRTAFGNEIGWTNFIEDNIPPQVFEFEFDGVSLVLDVQPKTGLNVPAVKVFDENVFVNPIGYTITLTDTGSTITFNGTPEIGASVQVLIISDEPSAIGYYKIPKNLENNIFNENNNTLTLGTVRNHYNNLAQNLLGLTGGINGANNSRDLGAIDTFGDVIIQNSAPLAPLSKFLASEEFNFFDALEFNANSYERYKQRILDYVIHNSVFGLTPEVILDNAIMSISANKSPSSPFYATDMLPCSALRVAITNYTVSPADNDTFNITEIHDFTKATTSALSVYLNRNILLRDIDYIVPTDSATIQILSTLAVGDTIRIREYESAVASFCPATPTKIGLYPKYKPQKYEDCSYITPTQVIQGHDGSITVAFNDFRDDVLLEFESRIFNNIKVNEEVPIIDVDVIPGKFRTTDYTDTEVTTLLSTDFLNWVGQNRLDYKAQDFRADEERTWNFSTASNKLDGTALKGHWRGIYQHHYDTQTPCITPWEMIGFREKPTWFEAEYGPAPYTSGNLVLWDDLEEGRIKEPSNERIDLRYARPGLTNIIPTDSEGNILDPFKVLVQNYSEVDLRKSWVVGDIAPVESVWRRSSSYPFALQRLFALTKPAQYFALGIDRDRYAFDTTLQQFLYDDRYRLDTRTVEVKSNSVPKHSYINWIIEYNKNSGFSDGTVLTTELSRLDVRLCYRMAAFSDKSYLKVFTDRSSPDTANSSLLLPDQSFQLLLHKNQPITELQYSSVIVQRTDDGYAIFGNSQTQQFFQILESLSNNNTNNITVGNEVINLPKDFSNNVTLIPYGFVFTTTDGIIDFLASYGAFLETQGLKFETSEDRLLASGETTTENLNWARMAQEFLQWVGQGWDTGSVLDLNPSATTLEFEKALSVVDNINALRNQPLDQNGRPLTPSDYVVTRLDNNFKIRTINSKSTDYMRIKTTSYEHLLVLDNVSIFNDLLYQPVTGLRQQRIKIVGFTTFEWNGQLDAQGFILNQDNVKEWEPNRAYTTGSIVKFKNVFWSASRKIEPSEEFNFGSWRRVNYDEITKGLLPNLSSKAAQISEYYNNKSANLEKDVDLLALGLIGFRPRPGFDVLDDISQVNFYSGFIDIKGTRNSTVIFRDVPFDKSATDYEIFENWAVQQANYGGSSNKSFIDLELADTKLQDNPTIVELASPNSTKIVDYQLIKTDEIFKQSEPHPDPNVFPILNDELTDITLPIAGHVHADDADIALFQLTDFNDAVGAVFLDTVADSSLIWVAKDNAYDWNVYRSSTINFVASTSPSSSGRIHITFFGDHGLSSNDKIIIQNTNSSVNGLRSVLSVASSDTIEIEGQVEDIVVNTLTASSSSLASNDTITADNTLDTASIGYKLSSVRTAEFDDLFTLFFGNLPTGSLAWVDNNSDDKHATYEKFNITISGNVTSDNTLITIDDSGTWVAKRTEQDVVDVSLINRSIIYNKETNQTKESLDYIDPINGKILGIAQENIDYIGANDPASYNQGTDDITGVLWAEYRVGQIWWDTTNARYLDYNQADVTYAARNWGTLFPGSSIDIRQWVRSSVHPAQYTGPGTVVDVNSFTVISNLDSSRTIVQNYFFWVTNLTTINKDAEKSLSINTIQQYIENPVASGISYAGFLQQNIIALFNVQRFLTNDNAVLHTSYNHTRSENNIFSEYNLIKENNEDDFLSTQKYRKLQDSFVGGNTIGFAVPDPNLGVAERLGIKFRPRQSMFDNRFNALEAYLVQVNNLLAQHIISPTRDFTLLNDEETPPGASSGEWDFQVADLAELGFQDLNIVALGFKYLVDADTDNNGGWSIYEVVTGPVLQLVRVQKYDTTRAWNFIDWYESDAVRDASPTKIVDDFTDLSAIEDVEEGNFYKVRTNSAGKFEIYQFRSAVWVRVALEDGTIVFKDSLYSGISTQDNITIDTEVFTADTIVVTADTGTSGIELRNSIRAINEDLLVDNLKIERNKLLISIFNFILSEQGNVEWLYKTSLIDIEHKVRDLLQFPTFKRDNQDFLLGYITEAKPYHVKIKEFLLRYDRFDQANIDTTDFDVPSYFDTTFNKFISPILDYDGVILTSDQSNFDEDGVGLRVTDPNIWTTDPWNDWFQNRLLIIEGINLVNTGTGFTTAPTITVTGGGATTQATMTARINTSGEIIDVTVDTPGIGYLTRPTITVSGGGGTGAIITPILKNDLVRSFLTTIKYDRYEYQTNVINWQSDNSFSADSTIDIFPIGVSADTTATFHCSSQLLKRDNKVYLANEQRKADSDAISVDMDAIKSDDIPQTAGNFDLGFLYEITAIGTTDFTTIGADTNTVGELFRATGIGLGTGTANKLGIVINTTGTITADCEAFTTFGTSFDLVDYTEVDICSLSGVDRTFGYYQPDANDPGLDLGLLINGINYPGVQVQDLDYNENAGFDIEPFDTEAFDAVEFAEDGSAIYSEGVLDTEYSSLYNDLYLGTLPGDINVDGSGYVDTYSSHSPEELVPGAVFDTLDLTVHTIPGFDYDGNGHGFEIQSRIFEFESGGITVDSCTAPDGDACATPIFTEPGGKGLTADYCAGADADACLGATATGGVTVDLNDNVFTTDSSIITADMIVTVDSNIPAISFAGIVEHPIVVRVANITNGIVLYEGIDYTIDWATKLICVTSNVSSGERIQVFVYEIGGGNQLFRQSYLGSEVGNQLVIPVESEIIFGISIFVNGVELTSGFTITNNGAITVDQTAMTVDNDITIDTISTGSESEATIDFTTTYTSTDFIAITAFGFETLQHDHSHPITTILVNDGTSTSYDLGPGIFNDKNAQNALIEVNGLRLRPPEAVRYEGDGITTEFFLPFLGDVDHSTVADNEVVVYIDEELQTLSTDYVVVDNTTDTSTITVDSTIITVDTRTIKQVSFDISSSSPPPSDTNVDVYITTAAEYKISGTVLTLDNVLLTTDVLAVTTWEDTSQLDILTSVFVGPTDVSGTVVELFDSVGFDTEAFDSSVFTPTTINLFDLGEIVIDSGRLWVTLNRRLLLAGSDYTVSGSGLFLLGDLLGVSDVLAVTSITDDIVPEELTFRIFKDMKGNSAMYKIDLDSTTITQNVAITDDVIFVNDATQLAEPNLDLNIFGIVIIDGERITYRERNLTNNSISGLRRGTAGTSNSTHTAGTLIADIGVSSVVPGSIILDGFLNEDLGSEMNIVPEEFDSIWYAPGVGTPSNGIALQDQTTAQANFIKS